MSEYAGILSLCSSITGLFSNDRVPDYGSLTWDSTDVSVDDELEPIPCLVRLRLYRSPRGFYVVLHPYSESVLVIEKMKDVFDIPRTPYNTCTINKTRYIAYMCDPDQEHPHSFSSTLPLTKSERLTLAFHWITKTSGRYWAYTNNDRTTVYSGPPYRTTPLSNRMIKRLIPDVQTKAHIHNVFSKTAKLNRVRSLDRNTYLTIVASLDELSVD
jgi:hypothetical protein